MFCVCSLCQLHFFRHINKDFDDNFMLADNDVDDIMQEGMTFTIGMIFAVTHC